MIGRQLFIKDSLVDFYKYSTRKAIVTVSRQNWCQNWGTLASAEWLLNYWEGPEHWDLSWVSPLSWYQLDWCLQFRPRKPKYTIQKRMICWFSHFCSVSLFRIWRKDKWHLEKLMIMASIQEDDIWWRWWSEKKLEN